MPELYGPPADLAGTDIYGPPSHLAGGGSSNPLGSLGETLLKNPNLLKGAATLVGGLLGQRGAETGSGSGSGNWPDAPPNTPPQMYGGNAAPPTFQTVGPTETERRMTQQYLPSLFQQQGGLLGGRVPPIRRGLFGITRG
jgi:hypothetical protein